MKKGLVLRFDSAALFTVYLRRLVVAYRFILPLLLIASAYPATAGGLIETWTAASTTASSITGDVRFSGDKITFQRSEEHTSELQSLMRISSAVFCLKKKKQQSTSPTPLCNVT